MTATTTSTLTAGRVVAVHPFRLIVAALIVFAGLALVPSPAGAAGADQIGGTAVGFPNAPDTCDPTAVGPVNYILAMPEGSGSLVGCIYGVVEEATFNAGGQFLRRASETFVGCFEDRCGSFQLDATITSRWVNGEPFVGDQVNGRCQHKIVRGSGTGDFEGVNGRLDFKDILERDADGNLLAISFDYKGHLK